MLKWKLLLDLGERLARFGPRPLPKKGYRFDYDIKEEVSISFFYILSKFDAKV